jgi:hypothetical protein
MWMNPQAKYELAIAEDATLALYWMQYAGTMRPALLRSGGKRRGAQEEAT